jgi:hypothetical protein
MSDLDEKVYIQLSKSEAIVIFELLSRADSAAGDCVSPDAAEWRAMDSLCCGLESVLVEPFKSDYLQVVRRAKQELLNK